MSDTILRTSTSTLATEPELSSTNPTSTGIVDIEVPYMDYESSHHHPYLVDHFKLGDTWDNLQGGFPREVAQIEGYIENKIQNGEMANSITAVKTMLKGLEKLTNVHNDERSVVKIETLNAYIEFLNKTDKMRSNLRRYNAY